MSASLRPASRAVPGVVAPSVLVGALDPGSTRLVYAMVAGLVLVGIVFVVLGVWLVRQTRYDPPMLAPLERMGDADWRKRDEATQRRILDDVRPTGAKPLRLEAAAPTFDTEFDLARREPGSVSDLGPGVSTPTPPPPPPRPQPIDESEPAADASVDESVDESTADAVDAAVYSDGTADAPADEHTEADGGDTDPEAEPAAVTEDLPERE